MMHHTILSILMYVSFINLYSCGQTSNEERVFAKDTSSQKNTTDKNNDGTTGAALVNTDDPAIAIIQTGDACFKLHGLFEFTPQGQPGLPVDPAKKYIMADISVENTGDSLIYPAGYMLAASLIDDKGNRHGFVNSVKTVALFDGHPSNKFGREETEGFTSENFPPGAKARGFLYGFEVDKNVVFTKMTIQTNDTLITAVLKQ